MLAATNTRSHHGSVTHLKQLSYLQYFCVAGRSHNAQYTLFRVGTRASPGVKEFTETGQSGTLDSEAQGDRGVLDMFTGPPIYEGAGRAEAQFFLDGNHSRVSYLNFKTTFPTVKYLK